MIVLLIISALATWRISFLITNEEPLYPVLRYFGVEFEEIDGVLFAMDTQSTFIRRGLTCLYCTSWWIGLFIGSVLVLSGAVQLTNYVLVDTALLGFALSTSAILLDSHR